MTHTATINVYEAKTHLSQLLERAAAGEEIIIAKAGRPMARLMPLASEPLPPRVPGILQGKMTIRADFEDPLPDDLIRAFYGEES